MISYWFAFYFSDIIVVCTVSVPASPLHNVLCLRSLMFSANTASPVLTAKYSLDWAHRLASEPCPGTHHLVSEFVNVVKRILAHHTKRKEPISVEQLERLAEDRASTSASLMDYGERLRQLYWPSLLFWDLMNWLTYESQIFHLRIVICLLFSLISKNRPISRWGVVPHS